MLRRIGATLVAVIAMTLAVAAPAQAATARYYSGGEVDQIVENFTAAAGAAKLHCFVADTVKKMKKAKSKGGLPAVAALSAEISAKIADTKGACKGVWQFLGAATWTALHGRDGAPVWIEDLSYTDKCGIISKKINYIYRIGPSPSETTEFTGSVKVICSFSL
ncbi:hypothetical protein [Actinoplanes solisilvae]|uniref:hypothetical protein n=1 Tax=Actinoplanes solisilvae TaxID=2486853 RepID=UPI000FD73CBA|nr:hypothetical protein [Actinoplanes solisilvae]